MSALDKIVGDPNVDEVTIKKLFITPGMDYRIWIRSLDMTMKSGAGRTIDDAIQTALSPAPEILF